MTREEWQKAYDRLDTVLSDFQAGYSDYKHGKNKKIRDAGERKMDHAITIADAYITGNIELYKLLTGEEGSDYSRAINYDEFKRPNYFGGDLSKLLRAIKEEKISSRQE